MILTTRLKEIDFLRGIAIILVLFRHFPFSFYTITMGWIGVDLFFVLSGFLISGLLFTEYKKTGKIKPGLFLIRRGFKIYPLFYLFIIGTIICNIILGIDFSSNQLIGELTFLQNYIGRIWNHTWSLAVEEHFYISLCIFLSCIDRKKLIENRTFFYGISGLIFIVCLTLRIYTNIKHPEHDNFFETHLRIDSLFAGVLISHLYHFDRESLLNFSNKYSKFFPIVILLCISFTPFIEPEESFFIRTIGFTLLYIAFGLILIITITKNQIDSKISKVISKPIFTAIHNIGFYSYSIYIIHMTITILVKLLAEKYEINTQIKFVIYFSSSIFAGIFISKLIEIPFLKLRDRFYPKQNVE